jgi:hypothetical protein
VSPYSNIPGVDEAFDREGRELVDAFRVTPAGGFFDDTGSPNAFATPEQMFDNGPDGTIIFGLTLLAQEARRDGVGVGVIGIFAHEFAHIRQIRDRRLAEVATPVRELHADYLAGWYLAQRGFLSPAVAPALQSFFEKGDYGYFSPNHHGTPEQRLRAIMSGLLDQSTSIDAAFSQGLAFVEY